MYGYHFSVARTVLWFSDEYIRTKTWEYLKKAFGEALYIAPMGFLVAAKVSPVPRREKVRLTIKPKAKLNTLVKRGYLPVWYLENIQCMRGPAWMIPLPLRGQRKMCRWQLPPRGKQSTQNSDGGGNSIAAINLSPEEWRPKDAYDIVDES
jgi:hypothetical protein